jgi:hypothetical protein
MLGWVGLKGVWTTPVLWPWIHAMACVDVCGEKSYSLCIELFFADDFFMQF